MKDLETKNRMLSHGANQMQALVEYYCAIGFSSKKKSDLCKKYDQQLTSSPQLQIGQIDCLQSLTCLGFEPVTSAHGLMNLRCSRPLSHQGFLEVITEIITVTGSACS